MYIRHSYGENFSTKQWYREIAGQREILHRFAGIPRDEIRGMRAPFLQIGGDEQFQMLMDANMTYDSSISIFDNAPPYWPYTLDFGIQHDCMITPCPTRSYPGKIKNSSHIHYFKLNISRSMGNWFNNVA